MRPAPSPRQHRERPLRPPCAAWQERSRGSSPDSREDAVGGRGGPCGGLPGTAGTTRSHCRSDRTARSVWIEARVCLASLLQARSSVTSTQSLRRV
jgi:hypothetical protein